MLVLAIENSAAMSFHYQNLYDLYIDHLLENYLTSRTSSCNYGDQQLKGNSLTKSNHQDEKSTKKASSNTVLFTTYPDGKIHFKSNDKSKIKSKYEKLEMVNGQSRTNNVTAYIRNLSNCIKYSHQMNDDPIHIVFVTCTIPIIHHTLSLGEQSPESILIQDLVRISTLSIISPFTKNLIAMKKSSASNSNVNHSNLFLYFNCSQNILIENQQNDSILVHPFVADLVKNKNDNLSNNLQPNRFAPSPYTAPPSIKSQSVSTPVSAPSPSAYPPPTKFTKDNLSNPIQAKASPVATAGKINSSPANSNTLNMVRPQNQQIANTVLSSNTIQQQKTANQNVQPNGNLNQLKQSSFIPTGNMLTQQQQAQLQAQQKLFQQQTMQNLQLQNMYQAQQPVMNNMGQVNMNPTSIGNMMGTFINNNQNNNINNMMGTMNSVNAMNINNSNLGLQNPNLNNQNIQEMLFQQQLQQQQLASNGMVNQMTDNNNTSFVGNGHPFLAAANMQMQQKQMPVWTGTCKWPLNGSTVELMFTVAAIPRRPGNASDYALQLWPSVMVFDRLFMFSSQMVDLFMSRENIISFVFSPNAQTLNNYNIFANQLSQSNQGAAIRFSNTSYGIIFGTKQGQLVGFLFTKDNLFDQAIAKVSGNVGLGQQNQVGMNQQQNQANLAQMQFQQQMGIQGQPNMFLMQQQQPGFMTMPGQMPGLMSGQQMQNQMLTAQQRIAMSQQAQQHQQQQQRQGNQRMQ